MMWNEFRALVGAHRRFLISSHLSLDGDSVGSQVAMKWYLESLGKEVTLYNHDPVPGKFTFLAGTEAIGTVVPAERFDVVVILDCSNPHRLGWDVLGAAPVKLNIDHHRDNNRFGDLNIVDEHAAATGAIIYRFFSECAIDYPPQVAEALYTAILTDTGGFRFSNTSSTILQYCADLARHGADCAGIYERVYSSHPRHALQLQARIWSTLSFYLDGKVCCMIMPLKILDELGARYSDSEGMADNTITAEGVEVGVMVKYSDTETHFSLRSRGTVDVGKIAQRIPGGGGHFSAAGCTVVQPFEQAFPFMLDILKREIG